jgi:hypothetical protein
MPVNDHRNDYPENVPSRLIDALCEAGSERELSRRRGVNILYVSQLIGKGVEPTDQTAKGQAARVKLFLPRTKRAPREPKPEEWFGQKNIKRAIRAMVKDTKRSILRRHE